MAITARDGPVQSRSFIRVQCPKTIGHLPLVPTNTRVEQPGHWHHKWQLCLRRHSPGPWRPGLIAVIQACPHTSWIVISAVGAWEPHHQHGLNVCWCLRTTSSMHWKMKNLGRERSKESRTGLCVFQVVKDCMALGFFYNLQSCFHVYLDFWGKSLC